MYELSTMLYIYNESNKFASLRNFTLNLEGLTLIKYAGFGMSLKIYTRLCSNYLHSMFDASIHLQGWWVKFIEFAGNSGVRKIGTKLIRLQTS